MAERCIVVQTQPRRELWAAENIDRLGYRYYFPKIQVFVGRGNLKLARAEPLFPRHIFVYLSHDRQWHSLTGCWGVSGVIMWGSEPGFVPEKEIDRIRALEGSDGMINLPAKYAVGDEVRVSAGAFAGFVGIYDGDAPKDRLRVLLNVLGHKTTVLIAEAHVEPA